MTTATSSQTVQVAPIEATPIEVAAPTTSSQVVEVSIVLPCLNEHETLATCIGKAQRCLRDNGVVGEVVVADNGSTDGSREIALENEARVVDVEAKGYGSALIGGIRAARGEYVIMADADDSYDFSDLMPFISKLREGHDLVMGNRFRGGIAPGAMPFLHRYLGNPVLTAIGRLFFKSPCRDFHCGMRGFRRRQILDLDLRTSGMEFASELVVKATLQGLKVAEVGTTLSQDGRSRPPHLRTWRDGWRHLRFLLLYCPRWLFLYPGVAVFMVACGVGLWLLPQPRMVGGVTLDVHTLLFCAGAGSVSYQAITFALIAKVFAVREGLLPESRLHRVLVRHATLEAGLVAGLALVLIGLGCSIHALSNWGAHSFGPFEPTQGLRWVIPSVFTLVLGFQTILSSFLLSLLGLVRR